MTIADKIAELPKFPDVSVHPADVMDREVLALSARLDLALEVLRFTQCLCSVHVTCDRCAVLAACRGESE
jgi:hypothetical protein